MLKKKKIVLLLIIVLIIVGSFLVLNKNKNNQAFFDMKKDKILSLFNKGKSSSNEKPSIFSGANEAPKSQEVERKEEKAKSSEVAKQEQEKISQDIVGNLSSGTGIYESKMFNEAVINELMQSRLLEISSMKEKQKTNSIVNTLRNELYRGILELVRDDPEFRKNFLIGFAQKEFGITAGGLGSVGPFSGLSANRNLSEYGFEDLKKEVMEELKKNEELKYGSGTVEGVINSVGVESQISSKIMDRTISSIQNFLLSNLRIEGILKKDKGNVAYIHLGDSFLNIKEGESLPKKFEGVNWYMKKIKDDYITITYSLYDGKSWKTHDFNLPYKISYANNGDIPNYFVHSLTSKGDTYQRKGRSIVLPSQVNERGEMPNLKSLLKGQPNISGNRFPNRGSSSSITRSLGIK